MDKKDKTKVSLDRDVANALKKRMDVGETYTDVIRKLLKNNK